MIRQGLLVETIAWMKKNRMRSPGGGHWDRGADVCGDCRGSEDRHREGCKSELLIQELQVVVNQIDGDREER